MKKKLLLVIPAVAMAAACTPAPQPEPPGPEHPELDLFNELCNQIQTGHNYSVDIYSKIDGSSAEDVFESNLMNLNDRAIYTNGSEVSSGVIYQKDLGYVNFDAYENLVLPSTFYCSNPNLGIHDIYDCNIENIVKASFTQNESDKTKFSTTDATALLVAGQFTGYMDTAWIRTADVLNVSVDTSKRELVFTYEYQVGYIEDGEIVSPHGLATFTVKNIGTTSNQVLQNYIENPTSTFQAPTAWNDATKEMFNAYYAGFIPSFVPGASLYFSTDSYLNFDGNHISVIDIGSGDLRNGYAAMLQSVDGFAPVYELPDTYTKEVEDRENLVKYIFNVTLSYNAASEEYNGHTIGYYYPKGVFKANFSMKKEYLSISTVKEFNDYIELKEHTGYVPYLMDEPCVSKIGNFEDHTKSMIETYGEGYRFYMTKPMRIYISDYDDARDYASRYIERLSVKGYTKQQQNPTDKMWQCSKEGFDSFIKISDFNYVTKDLYPGYIDLLFQLRVEDDEPVFDKIPLSLASGIEHIVSYSFLDGGNHEIHEFDKTDSAGMFFARFSLEQGYEIESIIIVGDTKATAQFDEMNDRWEIKPGDLTANSIVVKPVVKFNDNLHTVSKVSDLVGGKIVLTSGETAHTGEEFKFSCKADDGYEIESISAVGHPEISIRDASDPIHPSTYAFIMPNFDVTLTASFKSKVVTKYNVSEDASIKNGRVIIGESKVGAGEKAEFMVKPSEGYELESISITDGIVPVLNEGIYSFTMPAKDVVISATFKAVTPEPVYYSISKDTVQGVTFVVDKGMTQAEEGDKVSFSVELDEGYTLNSVSIKNHDVQISSSVDSETGKTIYSFNMPAYNVIITASVNAPVPVTKYKVSFDSFENGNVTLVEEGSEFEEGATVYVQAIPNSGYQVKSVFEKNGSLEIFDMDDGYFAFEMPAHNVVIGATFEVAKYNVTSQYSSGGQIKNITPSSAEPGSKITFEVAPKEDFSIVNVYIVGHDDIVVTNKSGNIYTFTMPNYDVVIGASYKNNNPVQNVGDFNSYISAKGLSYFVPNLPNSYSENLIASFKDGTEDYNKIYGDVGRFVCKGSPVHVKFDTWMEAKDFASSYVDALDAAGYTDKTKTAMGGSNFVRLAKPDAEFSYIQITDPDFITSSFGGTLDIIYYLMKSDDSEPIPASHLISFSGDHTSNTKFYSEDDNEITKFESGDCFLIRTHIDDGYKFKSATLDGDADALIDGEQVGDYFEIMVIPSKTLDTYHVSAVIEASAPTPTPSHLLSFTGEHTSNVKFFKEDGETQITKLEGNEAFLINMSVEAGYEYKSSALEGDDGVQIYDWFEDDGTFTLYVIPSKELDNYFVSAVFEASEPVPSAHSISTDNVEGVSLNIDDDLTEAVAGAEIIVEAEADPGYTLNSVSIKNHSDIEVEPLYGSYYYFVMPDYDVVVTADVTAPEPAKYAINKDTVEGATIKIGGLLKEAEEGEVINVSVDLESGYTLNSVSIKDHPEIVITQTVNPFTSAVTYQFSMPAFDVTVTADVSASAPVSKYNVSSSPCSNGMIELLKNEYEAGEKVTFTVTPDSGYEIDLVSTNPLVQLTDEGEGVYSFIMPEDNVTISATFKEQAGPEPVDKFSGTFVNGSGDFALILQFNEDGTGSYTYSTESVTFTYVKDGNVLSLTYVSGNKDNFGTKALFINSDEAAATINADGNVVAKIGNTFTSSNKTFSKQ